MITCQRWPIPEMLLCRPDNFKLKVDSFMKECFTVEYARDWGMYRQENGSKCPYNSVSEVEEFDLYKTDTSEEKAKQVTKEEMEDLQKNNPHVIFRFIFKYGMYYVIVKLKIRL